MKKKKPLALLDMVFVGEDKRITFIGEQGMAMGSVKFLVDGEDIPEGKGKVDRYVRKLNKRYPMLTETAREPGPVPHTTLVTMTKGVN